MDDRDLSSQMEEEPYVAVKLELQSPVQTYRAPLPYVPVIMQAKGYQRATVVNPSKGAPQLSRAAASPGASKTDHLDCTEHRSSKESFHGRLAAKMNPLEARLSSGRDCGNSGWEDGKGGRLESGKGEDATGGSWDLKERQRQLPEEVIQSSKEGTPPRQDSQLFIWEKGDPLPRPSRESSTLKVNGKPAEKDNGMNGGTSSVCSESHDVEVSAESKNSINQDKINGSDAGCESSEESKNRRISNSWMLPMERDFSWNKPVHSVHKMICNYESVGGLRKKNCAPTGNSTMTGSRRLSKASRVPVSTLAERFIGTSDGSRD